MTEADAPFWKASAPFVLLDDAREGGMARLYRTPAEIVETRESRAVRACLERLRGSGLHAAGFLSYEAGAALEPKLEPLRRAPATDDPPLLWFGLFERCEEIPAGRVADLLPNPASAWAGSPRPLAERADYEAALAQVMEHILAGDIYQANLSFQAEVRTAGSPAAIYAAIRPRARAGHGALLYTGAHWLLSFSPELFFTLEGGRITTRPMKGTAKRGRDAAADSAAAAKLREDPKQRAENLMIVDLLRNDLSRVSRPGTVKVPELFSVETYPTVHQMTSTVTALVEEGVGPVEVLEAIFPCGSITGAPKIRAMEIIHKLEAGPRGAYTGAIGGFAPDGEASFNVAIRTLTVRDGENRATMGLGSGIVADSEAGDEWRECIAKGVFVGGSGSFDLIETMRFDPDEGVPELERHLRRMKNSAAALGFSFDRHHARNELQAATFPLRAPGMLRLALSRTGTIAIASSGLPRQVEEPVAVAVVPLPVASEDFRLRHKTSDRSFYEEARAAAGTLEVLFVDGEGRLTEGSFTSLFVERDGTLLTPPLSLGLLPGVLRERLIEEGRAIEAELSPGDLAEGFLIGNAVRGLIRARLA